MNAPTFTYGNRLPKRWGIVSDGHTLACATIPVRKLMAYDGEGRLDRDSPRNLLPVKWVEDLEHNQDRGMRSCCRHPEHHMITAWFSSREDAEKGIPDIYKFTCTAFHPDVVDEEGNWHRNPREHGWAEHVRFCVGGGLRPFWETR